MYFFFIFSVSRLLSRFTNDIFKYFELAQNIKNLKIYIKFYINTDHRKNVFKNQFSE